MWKCVLLACSCITGTNKQTESSVTAALNHSHRSRAHRSQLTCMWAGRCLAANLPKVLCKSKSESIQMYSLCYFSHFVFILIVFSTEKNLRNELGMLAQPCNSSTEKLRQEDRQEVATSLGYIVSFRAAWNIEPDRINQSINHQ